VSPRSLTARGLLAAVAGCALLLATAFGALAYFTAPGSGSASASIGTLAAPSIASATADAGTVTLSWTAIAAPGAGPVSYYVRRDGGAPSAACPSAASPSAATSCTDTGVSVATHSYTVTAVWRSWTRTSASATVAVTYGPVAQLAFTTQPAGAVGGAAFTTQPVVTARDAAGHTVPSYAGTVALSIKSGTGAAGATLSGCGGSLAGGVTTFTGCKIDKAASGYQLTASDGTRTVDSAAFAVTPGAVSQLVFSTQPAGATGGTAFATQPVVTAQDAVGNTVTSYAGVVALSIKSGTGAAGATLSGCARALSGGVTTFSGCKIDKAAGGYQLTASDGTRTVDSAAFAVTPGAVSQLLVTTQPGGAITGGIAFPTQPVVTAQDSVGNTVTSYAGTVTLGFKPGANPSGGTLSGCNGSLSGGVTTFAGCKIDKAGTGYQLRASDGTRTADTTAFNVSVGPAARFALAAATTTPTAGVADNLTITAFDAGDNLVTGYTGAHRLTFGGASASPSGTQPTVTSSTGTAVAFGSATTINFSNGVASVSGASNGAMVLRRAGAATITVTDGTASNGAGLAVTVSAGAAARLAWTSVSVSGGTLSSPCLFACTATGIGNNSTFTAKVSVTDAEGNTVANLGSGHTVTVTTPASGTGSGGAFTAPAAGTSVTLTIASAGAADSTASFAFKTQTGSWSSDTLSTQTLAGTVYTSASATIVR
jgi:hypothetical protein